MERYEAVMALFHQRLSQCEIAHQCGLNRTTVRHFIRAQKFLERKPRYYTSIRIATVWKCAGDRDATAVPTSGVNCTTKALQGGQTPFAIGSASIGNWFRIYCRIVAKSS